MSNAYILLDRNAGIYTSTDASAWTTSSLTSLQANGPQNGTNVPWDSVNSQWLVADFLGNIYKLNQGATTSNGTITGPTDQTACWDCDYKSSNGTLIQCGNDSSNNAAIWYSTNFGAWTKVILVAGQNAFDVRYDSGGNRWTCVTDNPSIYYSTNDGVSWTQATATVTSNSNNYQGLVIGGTNQILAQDLTTATDTLYSTNGTSYTVEVVKNSGLTPIGGSAGVAAFAYQASSGLFMVAADFITAGTNGIATTTTPGTLNSWTLYNNPAGNMGVFGALQGGSNWLIWGQKSGGNLPGLVLSTNGTTFTDISSHINIVVGLGSGGYASISGGGGQPFMPWLPQNIN